MNKNRELEFYANILDKMEAAGHSPMVIISTSTTGPEICAHVYTTHYVAKTVAESAQIFKTISGIKDLPEELVRKAVEEIIQEVLKLAMEPVVETKNFSVPKNSPFKTDN